MKIEQHLLDRAAPLNYTRLADAQLVLAFGSAPLLAQAPLESWRTLWPKAFFVGCGSAGEIYNERVHEQHLTLTAVELERSHLALARAAVTSGDDGSACGASLGLALPPDGLRHVFVLCDGLRCNPSALLHGLTDTLPEGVTISGALASNELNFTEAPVLANGAPDDHCAVAVGFYGEALKIGLGTQSGWDGFGPDRLVTRAKGNTLYELDGESALKLYQRYLGEQAGALPASAQRYPLAQLAASPWGAHLTRNILSVNAQEGSFQLCGSIAEGGSVRMLRAVPEHLIRAAHNAAVDSQLTGSRTPALAIVASGIGRRLSLGLRAEEELEEIRRTLGSGLATSGLYGYAQLAPLSSNMACEVHGQSISITSFDEV